MGSLSLEDQQDFKKISAFPFLILSYKDGREKQWRYMLGISQDTRICFCSFQYFNCLDVLLYATFFAWDLTSAVIFFQYLSLKKENIVSKSSVVI